MDESINGVDLQDNSIGRDKLGDAAVGPNELATESVDSDAIIDFTIQPRDIALAGPNQVLATTVNGLVEWQDQIGLFELDFDKDTNTLSIVPATGVGSNSINLEALVGSDDQAIEVFSFDEVNNIISLTLENGGSETINLSNLSNSGTDEQDLGLATLVNEELTINIENGNPTTADLSDFATDVSLNSSLALKEDVINKSNDTALGNSAILYPTQNAVKVYVDTEIADIVTSGGSDPINEQNQTFEVAGGELRITDISGTLAVPLTDIDTNTQLTDAEITALGYIKTDLDEQNLAQVLAQGQDANALQIKNLLDPTDPQDAATRAYVDANVGGTQNLAQVLAVGTDANALQIKNLLDPTDPQDAATRAYVDANSGGTQNLAQVLAEGTDANTLQIKNLLDPTDPQDAATQNYVETRIATILGAGGADGVVSNITPTATGFDVTGTNGGFNGSIDLDATFATDIELSGINIVSSDTPNSITTGVDGGALYDDTALSNAIIANTIAIAAKEDTANKSNDPTLADNSVTDFPTEQAVKTYVDNRISTVTAGNNLSNSNLTQAGEDRTYDLNNQNLVFTGLGSVGIGNGANPPQNKFHVAGEIRVEGVNSADGTLANPAYTFSGDTNNDTGMYRPAADEIGFSVGGQEALRMEEDGGTTNVTIFQSLTLENVLLDKDGDAGAAGQILSSTGTQTDWIDAPTTGAVDWSALTGIPAGFNDNIDNVLDEATVDGFVANNGYLTAEVDGSITNEIQILSILGNDLTLSNGGGTVTIPSAGAADWSTLTGIPAGFNDNIDNVLDEATVDGFVANNGYLTAEVDGSITNEIQILSILGNDLTLSNGGGTVTIPSAGAADWSTLTGIPAGFNDNIDDNSTNVSLNVFSPGPCFDR
ncbi:hypothetical protein NYZ99_14135 [Maribacter litopenaei]|uniref:Uncharacterized protein n=1 Tax=Maribacter litopenaei TaxID=2976127 RepID=A0ABY5Y542_9FLAO|nr:hypothetical protein [Maribacter litopenaei]UWX54146.1 hypothetical protein NYZ99_14135 [Maribacter litopenaei]